MCFRRRQAKLQKELADAAKEPLPIEACVSEFVSDVPETFPWLQQAGINNSDTGSPLTPAHIALLLRRDDDIEVLTEDAGKAGGETSPSRPLSRTPR